jgi:vacuolar-type H+-ATPase subunit D/Vma8
MKLFYTRKELQNEIDKARKAENERVNNQMRLDGIQKQLYELRVDIEKAHARINALEEKTKTVSEDGRYIEESAVYYGYYGG